MKPRIADIQAVVADYHGLRRDDLTGQVRAEWAAHPRQMAMYIARTIGQKSTPEIGRRTGGRDHSTVCFAIRQVEQRIANDRKVRVQFAEISARIHQQFPTDWSGFGSVCGGGAQ